MSQDILTRVVASIYFQSFSKVTKALKERTDGGFHHHSRICCWGLEIPQHQETETGLLGRKENAQIQNRCT